MAGIASAASAEPVIQLVNNQPFDIRLPVQAGTGMTEHVGGLSVGRWPAQSVGGKLMFVPELRRQSDRIIKIGKDAAVQPGIFKVESVKDGVALNFAGRNIGILAWGLCVQPATPPRDDTQPVPFDFDSRFAALPLEFRRGETGPVLETWTASAEQAGLKVEIELIAYREGFLDIHQKVQNISADAAVKVYAAAVCRWEQADMASGTLCYDNRLQALKEDSRSPFRSGEGRHWFTTRGADWVRMKPAGSATALWLNDFAPSFTVLDGSNRNTFHTPRYEGASLPQLGQEVQLAGRHFYSITEIARSNVKSYRDRLMENVLPATGEDVSFSTRIVLRKSPLTDEQCNQIFVAETGYNEHRAIPGGTRVSFGVPSVRFGTTYFPYSTLGENFDTFKLPGMDREAFWPLAADTVIQWRQFADDIRRDLRIAKAMGFAVIRLHHLELLAPIPAGTRKEYLDFLFGEMRHLGLRAMVDVYAAPDQLAELVSRHRDVIDTVELENETLIWGIPLNRVEEWRGDYEAVKRVAPQVRVHLTGYNNTGIFDRLAALGVPFDRVGLHSYVDSLDAIPSARGYALALGSYCSRTGKEPVITEWNWRGLARMSPDARAKIYPDIFDNALSTRAIPELCQFQFQETLCPNPRLGRGNLIRHYELINLSRRPKPEAFELMKLIRQYSAVDDPFRIIESAPVVVNLSANGKGSAILKLKNTGSSTLHLKAGTEAPADLQLTLKSSDELLLRPGKTLSLPVGLQTAGTTPGFYHGFVRLEGTNGFIRYCWIDSRLQGKPQIDAKQTSKTVYPRGVAEELAIGWLPAVVAYPSNAPVPEVEAAIAIASTLESATGSPVDALQFSDIPAADLKSKTVLYVGSSSEDSVFEEASRLASQADQFVVKLPSIGGWSRLVVGGKDPASVLDAGMDFVLRYWKTARDSAARRVGLVEKSLPRGGDATKLP